MTEKGKPAARRGRNAADLKEVAGEGEVKGAVADGFAKRLGRHVATHPDLRTVNTWDIVGTSSPVRMGHQLW